MLHDIGKLENIENGHALRSGEIVLQWLNTNKNIKDRIDHQRLIYIITNHSNKNFNDNDICSQIIKDADLLDELGAISILMQAYKANHDDYLYYYKILDSLKNKELAFCDNVRRLLQTKSGLNFVNSKINFIKRFISQLKNELMTSIPQLH